MLKRYGSYLQVMRPDDIASSFKLRSKVSTSSSALIIEGK